MVVEFYHPMINITLEEEHGQLNLEKALNTIRFLSADGVKGKFRTQAADGHHGPCIYVIYAPYDL